MGTAACVHVQVWKVLDCLVVDLIHSTAKLLITTGKCPLAEESAAPNFIAWVLSPAEGKKLCLQGIMYLSRHKGIKKTHGRFCSNLGSQTILQNQAWLEAIQRSIALHR